MEGAGTEWVIPWLLERRDVVEGVTGQGRGAPVSSMLPDMETAGLPVVPWQGSDVPNGTGAFYDFVRSNGLKHLPQPILDVAAATAAVKLTEGGAFMWDRRRSPNDAAPLVAATGAVWLLTQREPEPEVSVYETRGMVTL